MIVYNSVVVNLGAKCNASCAHCCFTCSPQLDTTMGKDYLIKLVTELSNSNEVETISFTGGEIFLDYPFLKELMSIVKKQDKHITLISNGFWGVNSKRVIEYFLDMIKYGVTALTISHDDFHAEYIQTKYVANILRHSKRFPQIRVVLNMAVTKSKMSDSILSELDDSILGIQVTKFPMISVGRAENFEQEEFHEIYSLENPEQLFCPGYEPVYHFDGEIYPCCSPGVFATKLSLKEDEIQSFERTIEKMNSNLLLYIIRKEGFGWFLDIASKNEEFSHISIKQKFSSICSICKTLFSSEKNIELFTPYMRDYYEQML